MVFLNALESMVSITLLSLVGYVLAWRGWISRDVEMFIPKFVIQITVPPYLMASVVQHFNHDDFVQLITESAIPFVSLVVSFFLFLFLGRLLGIDRKHLGLAATGAATSNTIFIGIPVNNALFGPMGLTSLLLYFLANTVFFWTFGNYAIAREGTHDGRRLSTREIVSHIFSPPLIGTMIGCAILMLGIPLPRFLISACEMMGGISSPLALILVGVILYRIDWKSAHLGKDIVLSLLGRILLTPVITIFVILLMPLEIPPITTQVYVVQAGLPCMTNIALISAYYGADKEFGSVFVCVTTIVGMISVPIWMTLVTFFVQ